MRFYLLYKDHGLYDPVLDDTEVIYETIGPADSDQLSNQIEEPTEVLFEIKQFTDQPELTRSLTNSPFLIPTKPYRPFSTEPLPVPPLEDPIILNPNYKDVFTAQQIDEPLPETRFKLPISAQYDAEYKFKKDIGTNIPKSFESSQTEIDISHKKGREDQIEIQSNMKVEEYESIEKIKTDIDLDKIEATAHAFVDKSIEKAVTVASEIKKEIDIELKEKNIEISKEEYQTYIESTETNEISRAIKKEGIKADLKTETKIESTIQKISGMQKNEKITKDSEVIEQINENISQKETDNKNLLSEQSALVVTESKITEKRKIDKKGSTESNNYLNMNQTYDNSLNKTREKIDNKTSSNLSAEHRAFNIGLQTIPNIRGNVHSSHQYNLLLKTFFIHLTDVMVALSRFILNEPTIIPSTVVDNTVVKGKAAENLKKETLKEEVSRNETNLSGQTKTSQNLHKQQETFFLDDNKSCQAIVEKEKKTKNIDTKKSEFVYDEENLNNETSELIKKGKLSGAKIAQIEGRKSVELTDRMDKVISEFERKSGNTQISTKEESCSIEDSMRTRNGSTPKEEMISTKQSLENITHIDSKKTSIEYQSASEKQFCESKTVKGKSEYSQDEKLKDDGKLTYVAIVEAHVYTNKEAIFAEQMRRMSEINHASQIMDSSFVNESFKEISENSITSNTVQARANMEASVKSIAAKTSVVIEEGHEIIEKENLISEKSQVLIEKPIKTVAEVKEVYVDEEKTSSIEAEILNTHQPKVAVDTTLKTVAQKTEVVVVDSAEPLDEIPKISTKTAKTDIQDAVALEVLEISLAEPKDQELKLTELSTKEPKLEIQGSTLAVAEVTDTVLGEKDQEILLPKVKNEQAKVLINESVAATVTEIIVLEPKDETLEVPKIATKTPQAVIQSSVLKTPETVVIPVKEMKVETQTPKKIDDVEIEYTVELPKEHQKTKGEEFAELKIVKYEIIEVTPPVEVYEDFQFDVNKLEVEKSLPQDIVFEQSHKSLQSESTTIESRASDMAISQKNQVNTQIQNQAELTNISTQSQSVKQRKESSQSAQIIKAETESQEVKRSSTDNQSLKSITSIHKSVDTSESMPKSDEQRKLTLRTDLKSAEKGDTNGTPTTPVLPTPLVDEYVFKLEMPLPKSRETTPVPRDCSISPPSEHEDPNIVKKKLIPKIDTEIEQVLYDPPQPTPPTSPEKKCPPKYVKPGLRGGSDRAEFTKEEIMDIEKKSSLLTSAIDRTIKSIEEYKESVGIDTKQEIVHEEVITEISSKTLIENDEEIISNGYVEEEADADILKNKEHETTIEEIKNNGEINDSEQSIEETIVLNGKSSEYTNGIVTESNSEYLNESNDVVETVTINLSKKRDSIQNANVSSISNPSEHAEEYTAPNGAQNNSAYNEYHNGNIDLDTKSNNVEISTEYNMKKESMKEESEKIDPLQGYRPVEFNPEAFKQKKTETQVTEQFNFQAKRDVYRTESGEIIGSQQGIVDGLEDPIVDPDIAKDLGKPGMPDEKIAELISGEAEMLREAHVMGLTRVLTSHMHRGLDDDSSVDFKKIKPIIESLKESEVLKALNEEILRSQEEKKKEERRWTTFLQKPTPKPKQKIVFCGNKEDAKNYDFERLHSDDTLNYGDAEPYRVRIVKQPKPRIAPDYKPEDFDTGPLPWEQRAVIEEKEVENAPPVEPEDPILIPEDVPEFVEAVDPLPESEVPDLEDTGIILPPSPLPQIPSEIEETPKEYSEEIIEEKEEFFEEPKEDSEDMEKNNVAEQLLNNIESMVDPNATLEEQLAQMRSQLAALAQLPNVIQQTLELVTKQISLIGQQKTMVVEKVQSVQQTSESEERFADAVEHFEDTQQESIVEENPNVQEENAESEPSQAGQTEEVQMTKEEEERMIEEQIKLEQQKKELIEQMRIEQQSRQVKQRSTPRVGKPRQMFGPPVPPERPVVLPGGRKWRKPDDAYNEQFIAEALTAQAEVIKGKAIGTYESVLLPYDERVNFMKYEKPPVSLDHLQRSEVYKVVHDMDETPLKRVEMLTPVIAEADYRERARSATPCSERMAKEVHFSMPQQLQP